MRPLFTASLVAVVATVVATVGARSPARLAEVPPRDALYSGLVGRWHGTRVVAGPSPAAGRVELTELVVLPAPDRDGLELRYRSGGGTRAVARSLGHWHFARQLDVAQLDVAQLDDDVGLHPARRFRVVEQSGGRNGTPLQLILETDGETRRHPARLRQQIDMSAGTLSIRREVQGGDGDYTLQEAFVLRRAD